jgi:hypothetical protein
MRRTFTTYTSIVLAVAVLMTVIAIALTGCGSDAPKRNLLVAVDYSASVSSEERADYTRKVMALADRQYGEAAMRYYVFARTTEFVWQGKPQEVKEMIGVSQEVTAKLTAQGKGTNLGSTLEEFAKQTKGSKIPF